MNLFANAPVWALAILAALLIAAAIEDAIRLRISNLTSLGVLLCGLVVMGFVGFPLVLWQNFLVFVILLAGGTLLFGAGKVGGGDVKMLATLGLWVNLMDGVRLVAAVFIAGGLLALLYVVKSLLFGRRPAAERKRSPTQIPYGLAIVAGALFMIATTRTPATTPFHGLPLTVR